MGKNSETPDLACKKCNILAEIKNASFALEENNRNI